MLSLGRIGMSEVGCKVPDGVKDSFRDFPLPGPIPSNLSFSFSVGSSLGLASSFRLETDPLGLSDFPAPGIMDLRPRNDRDDSLVSDFPREGYESRFGPGTSREGRELPLFESFEG